jgi:predicted PurR-regulated permease PerM
VYVGVQVLEGNLITPLAERSAVSLPAGLIISAQLLLGLLTGPVGLLVATPLLAAVVVVVRELDVVPLESAQLATSPGVDGESAED